MKNTIGLTICTLLFFSGFSEAQTIRNAAEAADNRQDIQVNRAQLERDIEELEAFIFKVDAFEEAYANKDFEEVRTLKRNILRDMHREINQSERKIAQDKREVTESQSELNASRREARRSRREVTDNGVTTNQEVRKLRDDRRDKRDDRRDVNDDKSDLNRQIARTARQKEILSTLEAFTFSDDPILAEKVIVNKRLIHEFISTMERDIEATRVEMMEDKGEVREDRRERREDRQGGTFN